MNTANQTDMLIPTRWRFVTRVTWLIFLLVLIALFLLGLSPRYREFSQVCTSNDCLVLTLNPFEVNLLQDMGLSLNFYATMQMTLEILSVIAFLIPAWLIFGHRSDTWIGIIISMAFLFIGLAFFAEAPRALQRMYPDLQPYFEVLTSITVVLFMLIFYIFPDGRFTPPWLKWVCLVLAAILLLDPLVIRSAARGASATLLVVLTGVGGALLGVISQVYRYLKVSNAIQRQQTKWGFSGMLIMFAMAIIWTVFAEVFPLDHGQLRLLFNFSLVPQTILISLFPIMVVISILRHRLWDIDLIIRRTVIYTLVSALLVLVYFGLITMLQYAFASFSNQQSPLTIVLSTLAIAAIFNPLRHRIQEFIDKRFYRQKYDMEQALTGFTEAARNETDMDQLTAHLTNTVQEVLQPQQVNLWLQKNIKPDDK